MIDQINPAAVPVATTPPTPGQTQNAPGHILAGIRERLDKLILLIPDPAYQDLFGSMREDMRVLLSIADARQEQIDLAVATAAQAYARAIDDSARAYLQALSDNPINPTQPT